MKPAIFIILHILGLFVVAIGNLGISSMLYLPIIALILLVLGNGSRWLQVVSIFVLLVFDSLLGNNLGVSILALGLSGLLLFLINSYRRLPLLVLGNFWVGLSLSILLLNQPLSNELRLLSLLINMLIFNLGLVFIKPENNEITNYRFD